MKKLGRAVALLLVLTLALSLAGCGFAGKMTLASRKMQKLKSYRTDMDVDMDLKLSVLGQSMDMDMQISGVSDVSTSPARTRREMQIGMFGQHMTVLSYTETTDAGQTSYSSADGGRTWTRKSAGLGDAAAASGKTGITDLLRIASAFEKTGTVTVRGEEADVYSGVITGADLESVSDLSDALRNAFSSMDMPMDELDLASYGSIPTTIAIGRRSGMVVRYTMDLTEFMGSMMPEMMDAAIAKAAQNSPLGGFNPASLGFTLDVGRVFASAELYDFDAVGAIEIPAAALDAPEDAA